MQFLATLVALGLPVVLAAPLPLQVRTQADTTTGCTATSFSSWSWDVRDMDFHASYVFTTPAHQNSWGYVNFNLTNPALGPGTTHQASCQAASSQLNDFFYGTTWYDCALPGDNGAAQFTFNRPSGELSLKQTWRCDDQDPQNPITFHATGSANLTLSCSEEARQNPDWSEGSGEPFSTRIVTCAPISVPLKPSEITAVA